MSGRSGSKISVAQNRTTISVLPTFSMLCVMPGRDVHDLEVRPGHTVLGHLVAEDRAEADDRLALEHTELLDLEVVVVVAAGDARAGPRDEHLAEVRRLEQLRQRAPRVGALLERDRRGRSGGRYDR